MDLKKEIWYFSTTIHLYELYFEIYPEKLLFHLKYSRPFTQLGWILTPDTPPPWIIWLDPSHLADFQPFSWLPAIWLAPSYWGHSPFPDTQLFGWLPANWLFQSQSILAVQY